MSKRDKNLRLVSTTENGNEYVYRGVTIRLPTEFIQDALEQHGVNVFVMLPGMIDYLLAKDGVETGDFHVRVRIDKHGLTDEHGTSFTPSEGASLSVSMFKREKVGK